MFSGIPFFPEQASTLAARVDNLYLFIVAVTSFFAVLVTVFVIVFAVKYRTDDPLAVGAERKDRTRDRAAGRSRR